MVVLVEVIGLCFVYFGGTRAVGQRRNSDKDKASKVFRNWLYLGIYWLGVIWKLYVKHF